MKLVKTALGVLSATSVVAACSGDPGSQFGKNGDPNGNDPSGGPGGMLNTGGIPDLNKCATASATPNQVPVNLVFMFDQSGSMSQQSKWVSCTQGLDAFFNDPKSKGISASMQFFPLGNQCSTAIYATPAVAMRALPDASFASTIAQHKPGGETPTLVAIGGAIQYAQQIAQQKPGEKVAIVLVTDGDPNVCMSTPQNVAAAAAMVASTIPTYVIGVGPSLQNLNTIAMGGGTGQATIVQTNNPQQIVQDFTNALAAIRGQTLGCEYTIPNTPAGQTLDFGKVNVVYTPSGGMQTLLPYSQDCSNMQGWHYDDPKAPKRILLCSAECNAVKGDGKGKMDVVFGCKTNGAPVN